MYFSATGTTKRIVLAVAGRIARAWGEELRLEDFTLPQGREKPRCFEEGDLVVFGVPVYAGRVPNVLLSYIRSLTGGGALAVPVVCYGNRNYDDALIELRDLLEAAGFRTVAAGAFVGEHSFSRILGAGRPDAEDIAKAEEFAERILQLPEPPAEGRQPVEVNGCSPYRPYYVPKDRNGQPVNILKDKPKVGEGCTNCGLCVLLCPIGSIVPGNVGEYRGICIKCGACVKGCPADARYYDSYNYLYHKEELELGFTRRAEPELFF